MCREADSEARRVPTLGFLFLWCSSQLCWQCAGAARRASCSALQLLRWPPQCRLIHKKAVAKVMEREPSAAGKEVSRHHAQERTPLPGVQPACSTTSAACILGARPAPTSQLRVLSLRWVHEACAAAQPAASAAMQHGGAEKAPRRVPVAVLNAVPD